MQPVSIRSNVADRARAAAQGPREKDPNRLYYPGFRLNDEKQVPYAGTQSDAKGKPFRYTKPLRVRILPSHPTKNPNGYVQQIKFKVPVRGSSKMLYVTSPASIGQFCPYRQLIADVDARFENDPAFKDFFETINRNLVNWHPSSAEPAPDPIALRNAEFLVQYETFCNVWNTYWIPAIIWADCEEKSSGFGSKYVDLVNYTPNAKNPQTRLLELGEWTMTRELLKFLSPPTEEQLAACRDENGEMLEGIDLPLQLNSREEGMAINISRQKTGASGEGKVSYEYELTGRPSGLPKDIAAKLDHKNDKGEEDNYPDIVQWKVMKELKSPQDMILHLLNSSMGDVLVEWGFLSTGSVRDEQETPEREQSPEEDDSPAF